jgi:hypothetical protein
MEVKDHETELCWLSSTQVDEWGGIGYNSLQRKDGELAKPVICRRILESGYRGCAER